MVSKTETPITGNNVSKNKKKNRKDRPKLDESTKTLKENIIKLAEKTDIPEQNHILLCIEALRKVQAEKEKAREKEKLFDDGERLLVQVTGIKLPKDDRQQFIRVILPHCSVPEPRDICLIVKDLKKGLKEEHESTLNHFNGILASKGIDNITQVISLRELKVEYKQFEAKSSLCKRFDIFLVDERILRLVPKFLGKPFYSKKRIPVAVNLKAHDLRKEIEKCVNTVTLPLSHHGTCAMVQVGNTSMKPLNLSDNIIRLNEVLAKRYPGGWKNIRALHIKTETSISIPIHVSTTSSNDVGFVDADVPKKIKRGLVTGELSTIPGVEVTITPGGNIRVVKTADPEWDDEENEPFIDASDDEQQEDDNNKEKDETSGDKKKPKKRKNESSVKKDKNEKKKLKSKHESDSEDEEINESEKMYMKKVAMEEDSKQPDEDEDKKVQNNEADTEKNSSENEESDIEDDDVEDEEDGLEDDKSEDGDVANDSDEGDSDNSDVEKDEANLSNNDNSTDVEEDSDEEGIESFDDQQEIDEKDVIVDDDDDDEEQKESDDDRRLIAKTTHFDDEDEELEVPPKPKKKSKKERRILQKQQKTSKSTLNSKKKARK